MKLFAYLKGHAFFAVTIVVLVVLATVIGGRVSSRKNINAVSNSNVKQVALVDVDSFRADSSSVAADGIIKSVTQADLKSQVSGPISEVNVALGDKVYAGQVLAQLQNADIRAQIAQAKTSLSLENVSVESARRSAIDTIVDSYQKGNDAVKAQLDQFVLNASGSGPRLSNFMVDSKLFNEILSIRVDLTTILRDWKTSVDALNDKSSDEVIQTNLVLAEKNINIIRDLLDKVSVGINASSNTALNSDLVTINSWKTIVAGARASIASTATSITNADKAFKSALTTSGSGEGAPSSIAQSGVQNLQVQLSKTIFTSPISGTVAALPFRTGELVSPGQLVVTVVGQGGLEVDAYVSGDDISRIEKGSKAVVQNGINGVVTNIAPIVSETSKKAQVKIAIDSATTTNLVIGQNVSVIISANISSDSSISASEAHIYRLPIQNVKIVPGDAYVFTLDKDSKTVINHVKLGRVDGDFIEIIEGLSTGMKIVSPVYEIDEGQIVRAE